MSRSLETIHRSASPHSLLQDSFWRNIEKEASLVEGEDSLLQHQSDEKRSSLEQEYKYSRNRLYILERWYELAIRPEEHECPAEDKDLLESDLDDCAELAKRSLEARCRMNKAIISKMSAYERLDADLVPRRSSLPNAGLGLFYVPTEPRIIEKGTVICHYWGHIYDYKSSKLISDKSYLMQVNGEVLVDAGPLPAIKARYINDPINDAYTNVTFRPMDTFAEVVALREIQVGEELFASYGEGYWSQQPNSPTTRK